MKKVIIFNAPPFAGKDYCVNYLVNKYGGKHLRFKDKLYKIMQIIYNINVMELNILMCRENKETKQGILYGKSPREALIEISEKMIKQNISKSYFGEALANNLANGYNFVSDGGFEDELKPILNVVEPENIFIIRLHRRNCTFENDSRRYFTNEFLDSINLYQRADILNRPENTGELERSLDHFLCCQCHHFL